MAHIKLKKVSFWYPVYDMTGRSLKVAAMRRLRGGQGAGGAGAVGVQALANITWELRAGQRLGLVGRNGAGKSTLLRMLAGLIAPDTGSLDIEGRVVPLIAKGLGIHPELSGLQNIELPMRLLGATNAEIAAARADIPSWTGLGDFIHLPVRTYSDGMRARLLFAICTSVRGDILILDEWLGAGDSDFVEKAQQRMTELMESSQIAVLSSHALDLIRRLCNVVCWMDKGRVVMVGEANLVLDAYMRGIRDAPDNSVERGLIGDGADMDLR